VRDACSDPELDERRLVRQTTRNGVCFEWPSPGESWSQRSRYWHSPLARSTCAPADDGLLVGAALDAGQFAERIAQE
jgi:hypothetical protein